MRFLRLLDTYVYELRHEGTVVSTGRLTLDEPPEVGETLVLNGRAVRIVDVSVREGDALLLLET